MEQAKIPEIKTAELLDLLDKVEWKSGFEFEFNGTEFYLVVTPADVLAEAKTEDEMADFGKPAEYIRSTHINGFDVYLHGTIPEKDRKRMLFHEILECNLVDQNFSEEEAHQITLGEEQRVFGERMNPKS